MKTFGKYKLYLLMELLIFIVIYKVAFLSSVDLCPKF
jgi:hypothetical protein